MKPANDSRPRGGVRLDRVLDRMARIEPSIFWPLAVLLTLAFVLGGSGRDNALAIMVIELAAIPVLALGLAQLARPGALRRVRVPMALLAAVMLTPLLQLTPLPPGLWGQLPGREAAVETLRLAQVAPGWAPMSLTPEATYRSFLWLLPAAAVLVAVAALDARRRLWTVGLVLGLCAASLVLAGLQLSDRSGGGFHIYESSHSFLPVGFFANRNHQGVLMAAGLPLAAAFAAIWGASATERRRPASLVYVALVGLFAVGILVTRSRAAVLLAGPALIAGFALFWTAVQQRGRRREVAIPLMGAVVILVVAAQLAIGAVLSRFEDIADREGRFDIWPVVASAAARVQPWGSGLGSFEALYRSAEPLNLLSPFFINHAHNDYLELWMETGLVFPLLLALFLAWFGKSVFRAWRHPSSPEGVLPRAASIVIVLLLLHSLGDYPLRMPSLACLFALAVGLMTRGPQAAGSRRQATPAAETPRQAGNVTRIRVRKRRS